MRARVNQLKKCQPVKQSAKVSGITTMDILEVVAIELRCVSCGALYEITLRQVLVSEQMLHEGCPVPKSVHERVSTLILCQPG